MNKKILKQIEDMCKLKCQHCIFNDINDDKCAFKINPATWKNYIRRG